MKRQPRDGAEAAEDRTILRNCRRSPAPARGYTILDLLVSIAIIGLLISILLPALARTREQAKYVRWQAISRDLSMDENLAVYYNFQHDRGGTSITNMAVANHDPSFLPSALDLTMRDLSAAMATVTNRQMITYAWSNDGRFRGKPAVSFLNSGPSNNMVIYPTVPLGSGMLSKLLRKSQAVTVAIWICVPPPALVAQGSSVLYWTDQRSERVLNVHLPWGNAVYWDTYGWNIGNRVQTTYASGVDSQWSLWCFTKDNRIGLQKIYHDGVLVAACKGSATPITVWQTFNTSPMTPVTSAMDMSNFTLGSSPTYGSCAGTVDELAIFDADLSPTDVTPTGIMLPNVAAVRFLQMYQNGVN